MRSMRLWGLLAPLLLAVTLFHPATARASAPERALVILTAEERMTQGMAFVLTTALRRQGMEVEMLLCGPAADLARREPQGPAVEPLRPMNATPAQMLRQAMGLGVVVRVCALYLPNAGIGPDALVEGVTLAQPPMIAGRMAAAEVRVFSF